MKKLTKLMPLKTYQKLKEHIYTESLQQKWLFLQKFRSLFPWLFE